MTAELSFPRQYARTLHFTLGEPRSFTVAPDGSRIVFLRSAGGTDRVNSLWICDLANAPPRERVVADPSRLLTGEEELTPQERARRERSRESSGGIVAFATDQAVEAAAFALSGRLFVARLATDLVDEIAAPGPVADPRPSPDGRQIAYVTDGTLRVVRVDGTDDRAVAEPDGPETTWGLADFIAAEEMDRHRGYWWSPDSDRLLAARVDNAPVRVWWIADPSRPDTPPTQVRYPAAGTPNADVSLALIGLDGSRTDVEWDRAGFPYLAKVVWGAGNSPLLLVQARDQKTQLLLTVDTATGHTDIVETERSDTWVELISGVPSWTPDGRLVQVVDRDDARVVTVDGAPLTGPDLHVRDVLDIDDDSVLVLASAGETAAAPEVGEVHVYRVSEQGVSRVSSSPGVHDAVRAGQVTVVSSRGLEHPGQVVRVLDGDDSVAEIASYADKPVLTAHPELVLGGERRIPCAVLLPTGYHADHGPLPVLMDPYGGPHGQRVVSSQRSHLTSQWFADQGFAVLVADGRGTPGRCPAWEKAVHHDLAAVSVADQVEALQALADRYPLDLERVAIRGWSYGGYLAALAVLRRPDVFHAGIAGAPVTYQWFYDTHYTERYLGDPNVNPEVYAANSPVTDEGLSGAANTHRPLMVIHGLADDNVVVAHTLRLSSALLEAGRPHEVLPLTGVTHMATQEQVAENLLLLQVDFLRRSLGLAAATAP
ncbi:MAG: S9 family peptidase [Nocardioidaceae bacterium]|nr:S9 family peptidase [Nocardioidaceae bacterium]